jgi:hypothetical protein
LLLYLSFTSASS